jgi:hypothetical protein
MTRLALILVLVVAGCAQLRERLPSRPVPDRAPPPVEAAAVPAVLPPTSGARTAEEFDTTTAEQRAAATNVAPAAEQTLGQVVVSLGDPADPGLWLETSLVSAPRPGRVVAPSGAEALVELRPGTGGARLSLPAMRLLGLPLTDLPTVTVHGR